MTTQSPSADEPTMVLRGASVAVDVPRVGRVLITTALAGLALLVVVLFWAGVQSNARITSLRTDGVPVTVTVTACHGLMGGSGSNLVGYECRGTLGINGHRYYESIPGSTLYPPGTRIRAVTVPGDPALLSTASGLASERASWTVFVVPTILLVVLGATSAVVLPRRRRVRRLRAQPARLSL